MDLIISIFAGFLIAHIGAMAIIPLIIYWYVAIPAIVLLFVLSIIVGRIYYSIRGVGLIYRWKRGLAEGLKRDKLKENRRG